VIDRIRQFAWKLQAFRNLPVASDNIIVAPDSHSDKNVSHRMSQPRSHRPNRADAGHPSTFLSDLMLFRQIRRLPDMAPICASTLSRMSLKKPSCVPKALVQCAETQHCGLSRSPRESLNSVGFSKLVVVSKWTSPCFVHLAVQIRDLRGAV
jgi:hypothetical protein